MNNTKPQKSLVKTDSNEIDDTVQPTSLMSLEEIVRNRRFIIPEYQRGYSWDEEQWKDLSKDIENLFGSNHKHYTGTIVATHENPGNSDAFEIVDGQQRLTTIMILLKEIYNHDSNKYGEILSNYLKRGVIGEEVLVLEPNKETRQFFKEVVINNQDSTPDIKSHESLLGAKRYFKKWLNKCADNIDEILDIVTNRLGFIFYSPEYDKEIGIMFEVINNRGKALSQLEKIKNFLIYWTTIKNKTSVKEDINNYWFRIQKNLNRAHKTSNGDENKFLRYCYLVFYQSSKEKSWDVYSQLKSRYDPKECTQEKINAQTYEIQNFLKFLLDSSRHYAWFYTNGAYSKDRTNYNIRINNVLKQLRCHPANASIMPLYLALMSRKDEKERVADLLELLEVVNFRVYVLPKITSRADSKQGHTFWLAHAFYWDREWHSDSSDNHLYSSFGNEKIEGDIFDWLELNLKEFTQKFCPEKKFIEALTIDDDEADDYYRWKGIRFFLASYEAELQRKQEVTYDIEDIMIGRDEKGKLKNDHLSLEHIWALNNRGVSFPPNHQQKRRLGNFVLMGLSSNINLSDHDIPIKINELSEHNSKHSGARKMVHIQNLISEVFPEVEKVIVSSWSRKTKGYYEEMSIRLNDIRETQMINFAIERWSLKDEVLKKFEKVDSLKAQKEGRNENYYLRDF